MSYQVIARKYRPQNFEEVIGQEHITKTLKNAIATGRIHHAYLFAGARGIGKTTVARILAKSLNCKEGPRAEPCGVCASCQDITGGRSLDVQEIDGASNTGVDDVREIRERAKYVPAGSRYKIYIIDEVHMLSTAAFNALLKILEEPPPHVVFIFATTESHKIPATILSRCQRYDFRRIPASRICDSLTRIAKNEGITIDEESLTLIAHEATGSLRDAQSLLDQAVAYAGQKVKLGDIKSMLGFLDRKLTFDLLEAVLTKDAPKALAFLNEVFDLGTDLVRFTMDFLACLRHLLVIKECGMEKNLLDVPPDEAERLSLLAAGVSTEELQQMFQIWYAASDGVARSPFPKMLLEVLLMRLIRVEPVRPISEILAELENLTGTAKTSSLQTVGDTAGFSKTTEKKTTALVEDVPVEETVPVEEAVPAAPQWQEYISWLEGSRPQIAAIFAHGSVGNITGNTVELIFDSPFYADMLLEADRKTQVEDLLRKFFKRPLQLVVKKGGGEARPAKEAAQPVSGDKPPRPVSTRQEHKRALTKEALEHDIVQEAAKVFNARVHDVLTAPDKKDK